MVRIGSELGGACPLGPAAGLAFRLQKGPDRRRRPPPCAGVLDIVAITGSSKASDADSIYSLKLSNGQRRQLHFTDNIPTQLLTGAHMARLGSVCS